MCCILLLSSSKSDESPSTDEPVILPPTTLAATSTASHSRRAYRNDKSNRFCKNQTIGTSNLATPRRPLRTPTSSPLTMGTGLDFISSRSRFVSEINKKSQIRIFLLSKMKIVHTKSSSDSRRIQLFTFQCLIQMKNEIFLLTVPISNVNLCSSLNSHCD